MNAQEQLLLGIADDELVLGWRDSEWTGIAPVLEEDVAFSSIAQNEIGHARAIYQLLSDDADALAFDREPDEYRSSQLVELRFVPDWARTIARRVLYEAADELRLETLMASRRRGGRRPRREDRPRGGVPPDARRDVARPAASTSRASARRWTELWPYALGLVEPELRAALACALRSRRTPTPSSGEHTSTSWPELWEEMTEVRRSVPGATW